MKSRLRLILVRLFFALIFVSFGVNEYYAIVGTFTSGDPGWVLNEGNRIAINHQSNAAPNELRDGDQVVSLNGIEYKNYYTFERFFSHSSPGDTYTILVKRDGKFLEFKLRTAPITLFNQALVLIFSIVLLTFPLTGLVIFLLKPDDKRAILLGLMLAMFYGRIEFTGRACSRSADVAEGHFRSSACSQWTIQRCLSPFLSGVS
jgi:hypothetical protein